jgi:hypothetical protein
MVGSDYGASIRACFADVLIIFVHRLKKCAVRSNDVTGLLLSAKLPTRFPPRMNDNAFNLGFETGETLSGSCGASATIIIYICE